MVRHGHVGHVLAGVFALALAAGPVPAQTFSDVVAFGDSLSDGGNFAALPESRRLGVPPGSRFTTNPDPTAADLLARAFGADAGPSAAGGQNRATGGACMDPQALCRYHAVPAVPEQIDAYLASRGGRADGGALYTVWGGANDIRDAMLQTGDPARAGAAATAAAAVAADQSRRLKDAGARQVVVLNLPDIAHTPSARAAAAILKPYVGERTFWVVKHHGLFQTWYYNHHFGRDRNLRDRYRGHPHYQACVDFCQKYDQVAFDPDFEAMPLEAFEPMVRRIFARRPRFDLSTLDEAA